MIDSTHNIKRVADCTGAPKKRPHRQGKPLRQRAKRVALPDGRFRFSDDHWSEIELFGFPPDARHRLETSVTMYRNGLVDSLNALPPAKTRQNLQRLAIAARKFCGEFQRVTDDARAWDLITDLRDWPLNRLDNWEQASLTYRKV